MEIVVREDIRAAFAFRIGAASSFGQTRNQILQRNAHFRLCTLANLQIGRDWSCNDCCKSYLQSPVLCIPGSIHFELMY
ncbi:hypothetical protein L596_018941 [Steinernema carpocapsae]|uniref:Uncharacterized protein n=1 Tax=Steinernema carpocapsae TaxID=34508 RepID=A0A4U5N650_STECR|nr:hypothetical protein L596_018941 [Steinernema carpocapsae]